LVWKLAAYFLTDDPALDGSLLSFFMLYKVERPRISIASVATDWISDLLRPNFLNSAPLLETTENWMVLPLTSLRSHIRF
jgi:hypothetical protein